MKKRALPLYHFTSATSTNDLVREFLADDPMALVIADEQTGGRGRHGKQWVGNRGQNVYCSLGVRQNKALSPAQSASYQAIGATAVADALRRIAPHIVFCIKYPNDVLALCPDGIPRKISGVLVEHDYVGAVVQSTVLGIGVNVRQTEFPQELAPNATSLALLGVEADVSEVAEILTEKLTACLTEPGVMQRWRDELGIEGKRVTLHEGREAFIVQKVLDDGTLLADTGLGSVIIYTGDNFRYEVNCRPALHA